MANNFMIQWVPPNSTPHEQFYSYAEMYRESLITLVNEINGPHNLEGDNPPDSHPASLANHDYGIISSMFLFRHYIELQLKGLILHRGGTLKDVSNNHRLASLLNMLQNKGGTLRISQNSIRIINELHQLDTSSQGFRYPFDNEGDRFFENTNFHTLEQANLITEFMRRAEIVINDLENQEGEFDSEDENRQNELENHE